MIRSRLKRLRLDKEEREGRKLTYRTLAAEAGLSVNVIMRLMNGMPDRVDTATVDGLCRYFGVGVGDLLEYVDAPATPGAGTGEDSA